VPIEYRQQILAEAYGYQPHGGGLILVEKVLGESDDSNRLIVDLYHGLKRENGYTQEAIDRKRLALEGVLVPLTASINEQWLRAAGYETVECIWRWCNFAAWLAVKR
jgi:tRNA (cmo5U34)-methyltransferase